MMAVIVAEASIRIPLASNRLDEAAIIANAETAQAMRASLIALTQAASVVSRGDA